jgi:hypothetical protein
MKKLILFTKECTKERPKTVVQEDNALFYIHPAQAKLYKIFDIQRLLWLGNSLNLNMIEPTWFYLKKITTKNGLFKMYKEVEEA